FSCSYAGFNQIRNIATLLLGHRSNAWQGVAVRTKGVRNVADEENVGMARNRKIRPNEHAPHPVGRNTEPTTGWRRHDTGTPYDGACLDPFAPERYAAAICGSYARLKPDLDDIFCEGRLRRHRKRRTESREHPGRRLDKNNARLARMEGAKVSR